MSDTTTTPPTYSAPLTAYRMASMMQGDTIEQVALRELGAASQWRTIVNVNGLTWPYVTDDPAVASATVLLTTSQIKVPATAPAAASGVTDETVFGTDLLSINGQLQVLNGDLATVSGTANLKAAIIRRITVKRRELPYYPWYGCLVAKLIGRKANAANNQLAASWVKKTVQNDSRIQSVKNATATIAGDSITVQCDAVTVDGKVLPTGAINVPN